MTVTTEIGKPRARKEDARLLTGQTNWTDNIVLPGMLHVCYVRSPGSWMLSVQVVCPVSSRASSLRARALPISVVTVMTPLLGSLRPRA